VLFELYRCFEFWYFDFVSLYAEVRKCYGIDMLFTFFLLLNLGNFASPLKKFLKALSRHFTASWSDWLFASLRNGYPPLSFGSSFLCS